MNDKLDELHYIYKMIGNYGFCTVQELLDKYNKQLDNWNKLKEFIVKEYYMYLPLDASAKHIMILIEKMQEIEQGSDNQ